MLSNTTPDTRTRVVSCAATLDAHKTMAIANLAPVIAEGTTLRRLMFQSGLSDPTLEGRIPRRHERRRSVNRTPRQPLMVTVMRKPKMEKPTELPLR